MRAEEVVISGFKTKFKVFLNNRNLGSVTLNVPGRHNALNALAAIVVGMELGMSFEAVCKGFVHINVSCQKVRVRLLGA